MQTNLFGHSKKKSNQVLLFERANKVKGLEIHSEFIDRKEELSLIKEIDNSRWLNDLSRRVQHYGFKYNYKARKIDNSFFLGELPNWLKDIAFKIYQKKIIDFIPDQAIINEYKSGQGIAPHIDCEPCFGGTIISLSLGSTCIMNFEKEPHSTDKVEILVEPRTILLMKKESRYNWYHGIPPRKTDKFNDESMKRERRISITFRKVIIE